MENVLKFALCTRVFVIILQYFSNIIIPDHEADAFVYPQSNFNHTSADKIIHHFLGGFVRWDAQYFMHIARYGYTYENTLAFFPLYPLTARQFALLLCSVFPVISLDSALLLVFIALNIILFVLSAKVLYKLSSIIFDDGVAFKSTLLFCVNPASIFFSAPYTECMFCYLTFQSILNCVHLYKKYASKHYKIDFNTFLCIVPISLSTVVRSNGILNIGFLIYTCMCICVKHRPKSKLFRQIIFITTVLLVICVLTLICLVPFFVYQAYCYYRFCTNFDTDFSLNIISLSNRNNFVLPGQFSKHNQSWCFKKIPFAYSYVQKHYWDVGFLGYYELKQVPNFLLAAPILVIILKKSCQHVIRNRSKNPLSVLSFDKLLNKKKDINIFDSVLNVFVIHILFLAFFCVFFVHIQVSTRMLCSVSPIFYWYCSSCFRDKKLRNFNDLLHKNLSVEEHAIIIYFLGYFILGTVLFCNFLPWT